MPTASIRKLILQKIETSLKKIVAGDTYFSTLKRIERASQNPLQVQVYPAAVIFETTEQKGPGVGFGSAGGVPAPFGFIGAILNVEVHFVLEVDMKAASDAVDNMLTDIQRCLMAEMDETVIGGTLVEVNIIGTSTNIAEAVAPYALGQVDLEINYRHNRKTLL